MATTSVNASQIAALNQTKTLVGLFKAHYQTQPDLAVEIYHTIAPQLPHPSLFLYRDQVMALGTTRLQSELVFDIPVINKTPQLYDIYQAALTDQDFRQATINYFTETDKYNNYVFKALTAEPDSSVGQFLAGNIPDNFLADPYLLGMSLALHLDGVWLAVTPALISTEVFSQLDPAELIKLTRRAVAQPDLIQALTTLGLFLYNVYAAYQLLVGGVAVYQSWLQNNPNEDFTEAGVLEEVVAWTEDNKIVLKPHQWQTIITAILQPVPAATPRSLLDLVIGANLATLVILASYTDVTAVESHGLSQLDLKVSLAKTLTQVDPSTDLTTVMARFQLSEADLMAAMTKDPESRYQLAILLAWYSGSAEVLNNFLIKAVTEPYSQEGHAMVSAWLYLAAIAFNLTVPQHNFEVVTIEKDAVAVLGYWIRRNYPKKVPVELIEFAEDTKFELLKRQSIVEDIYIVTEPAQDDANEF